MDNGPQQGCVTQWKRNGNSKSVLISSKSPLYLSAPLKFASFCILKLTFNIHTFIIFFQSHHCRELSPTVFSWRARVLPCECAPEANNLQITRFHEKYLKIYISGIRKIYISGKGSNCMRFKFHIKCHCNAFLLGKHKPTLLLSSFVELVKRIVWLFIILIQLRLYLYEKNCDKIIAPVQTVCQTRWS